MGNRPWAPRGQAGRPPIVVPVALPPVPKAPRPPARVGEPCPWPLARLLACHTRRNSVFRKR
jgi:hypothetical protein